MWSRVQLPFHRDNLKTVKAKRLSLAKVFEFRSSDPVSRFLSGAERQLKGRPMTPDVQRSHNPAHRYSDNSLILKALRSVTSAFFIRHPVWRGFLYVRHVARVFPP